MPLAGWIALQGACAVAGVDPHSGDTLGWKRWGVAGPSRSACSPESRKVRELGARRLL